MSSHRCVDAAYTGVLDCQAGNSDFDPHGKTNRDSALPRNGSDAQAHNDRSDHITMLQMETLYDRQKGGD